LQKTKLFINSSKPKYPLYDLKRNHLASSTSLTEPFDFQQDRSDRPARLLSQALTDKHQRIILFLCRIDSDFSIYSSEASF